MRVFRLLRPVLRYNESLSEAVKMMAKPQVKPARLRRKVSINPAEEIREKMVINTDSHSKLVIFDKDGTLISFDALWMPWANVIVSRLARLSGLEGIENKARTVLGVCSKTQKILPGVLAEGTTSQIKLALVKLLVAEGLEERKAEQVVGNVLRHPPSTDEESLVQLHDLKLMFATLKQYGVKTAICTSDSRPNTIRSLVEMELVSLVDKVVCGDDPEGKPKPAAHNAHMICAELNVPTNETVMVGDTRTDMEFAKNAKLSKAVGVLSGVGRKADLAESGADEIIASVEDILPIVLPSRSIRLTDAARRIGEKTWRLMITDKDGTLSDTRSKWLAWSLEVGQKLSATLGKDTEEAFYDLLGLDRSNYSLLGSRIPTLSVLELKQMVRHLLLMHGVHPRELPDTMEKVWQDGSQFSEKPLPGVVETLQFLRERGMLLGLFTSDVRASTENFLADLHPDPLFDCVVTAEDTRDCLKPLPHGVLQICERLGVPPEDTLMVGDSRADLFCGIAARVGATVGVLSGTSSAEALIPAADALIPNLTYLSKLLRMHK